MSKILTTSGSALEHDFSIPHQTNKHMTRGKPTLYTWLLFNYKDGGIIFLYTSTGLSVSKVFYNDAI